MKGPSIFEMNPQPRSTSKRNRTWYHSSYSMYLFSCFSLALMLSVENYFIKSVIEKHEINFPVIFVHLFYHALSKVFHPTRVIQLRNILLAPQRIPVAALLSFSLAWTSVDTIHCARSNSHLLSFFSRKELNLR